MSSIESHIKGIDKLTDIYGGWPSFQRAGVEELHLWGGPEALSVNGPFITAKLFIRAEHPASHNTLATLRFESVQDVKIVGFGISNILKRVAIALEERGKSDDGDSLPPYLVVDFQGDVYSGGSASFRCLHIEVVDAVLSD